MGRAVELAKRGLGFVAPNPPVGAVIVHPTLGIIGEGWHARYGGPHAEVQAVCSVDETQHELFKDCTMYVTLEPCNHHGKTPPCSEMIVRHGFKHVVIGVQDPNPSVNGTGIETLRNAGIAVTTGILEAACRDVAKAFLCHHTKQRPYYILKWAQTQDGFIGSHTDRVQISGPATVHLTHRLRQQCACIIIGARTAIVDDPQLTDRKYGGPDPAPIIWSSRDFPSDHALHQRKDLMIEASPLSSEADWLSMHARLLASGLDSVLVEGGQQLLQRFIDHKCWDELHVFTAQESITSLHVRAPEIRNARHVQRQQIDGDFYDLYVAES